MGAVSVFVPPGGRISLGGPVNMTSDVMFSDKFLVSDVLWTNLMLTGFLFF